jgi:hypothetical protein
MKLWQLVSIAREDAKLVSRIASNRVKWKKYATLIADFDGYVKVQNRDVLDMPVDRDFSLEVLGSIKRKFYLSVDNKLRTRQVDTTDCVISFRDSFVLFGADALESACEYGSEQVVPLPK